jgi:exopolysaccharide production protein ExoZ
VAAVSAAPAAGAGRIWGWDLLRGLCALAVMAYHLLLWLDLASLHTLGSYGVYLFFVLSGASLAHTYARRLGSAPAVASFFVLRWLRLTPLFVAVAMISVLMFSLRAGEAVNQLPLRTALNLTYAFGWYDPVVWSLPIGGWSLGIEFGYYLLFPLLMLAMRGSFGRWSLLLAAIAVQAAWIRTTAGAPTGYDANAVAYHQLPAFGAYFVAGCLIGQLQRASRGAGSFRMALAAWLGLGALLLALNPARAGDQLLGLPGLVLPLACVLVVWVSGRAPVPGWLQPLAGWLGDITYGSYLLHPVLFFGLTWFVLPPLAPEGSGRWLLLGAVMLASCLAAMASERWLESPVRRWGRQRTRRWVKGG